MRARHAATATLALALACVGCARVTGSGAVPTSPLGHDLVLRVASEGGYVAPDTLLQQLPAFSLYTDGRVITEGPTIDIYPGPALPNLLVETVDATGSQRILAAVRAAGLAGPDRNLTTQVASDMPTTVFTFVDGDTTHVIRVYGLGTEGSAPTPDMSDDEYRARRALLRLSSELADLRHWLPDGSVDAERPFAPTALRVYARPYANPDPQLVEPPRSWPLATPLAGFGTRVDGVAGSRCGVVQGADLADLMPMLQRSNQLTPWTSENGRFLLTLRPLLPDEHGC